MTAALSPRRPARGAAGAAFVAVLAALVRAALPCPAPAQEPDGLAAAAALERAFVQVIADAEPSVVSILRYRPPTAMILSRDGDRFDPFRIRRDEERAAETRPEHPDFVPNEFGAGIIIEPPHDRNDRVILTNYHVVKGGPVFGQPPGERGDVRLYVRFADRRGCQAAILAADPRSDLAVLKLLTDTGDVRLSDLKPLPPGDGSRVRKGQIVLALGNPYAMARDGSASAAWGMVSNIGRRAAPLENLPFDSEARKQLTVHHFGTLLQVSMPLDLGTSGGPLLSLRGELIGLTTSLAALDGYEKSAGHAVPLDEGTRRVIEALSQGYEAEYGLLGIMPGTVLKHTAPGLDQPSAASALDVKPGSPAALAGLRERDVIVAVDSVPVYSESDLMREVGNRAPGSTVQMRVWSPHRRGGRTIDLRATLAKWPPLNEDEIIATRQRSERVWRGLVVDYGTGRLRFTPRQEHYDVVLVREVSPECRAFAANSLSERVELQAGDFITHVEGQRVRNPEEFRRAVENLTGEARLTFIGRPDVIVKR
ncbi:MAG TPA: trypsin-like peptidase domain-containing protein [Planctomycetaceae bacterium]|nr:trypsin-like peptidase domain-containing protein [Planctomycetaceae bacterium]